jgi:hypothetical protein
LVFGRVEKEEEEEEEEWNGRRERRRGHGLFDAVPSDPMLCFDTALLSSAGGKITRRPTGDRAP